MSQSSDMVLAPHEIRERLAQMQNKLGFLRGSL